MLIKQKGLSLLRSLAHVISGIFLKVFSTKINLLYLLYIMALWYCALHLIKQNCSLKLFLKNSNRHGSSNSLVAFPSRTNHKLHSILLTPELDKKAITNLDSSKTSGSDCIILVVLKNWEPENLRILPNS